MRCTALVVGVGLYKMGFLGLDATYAEIKDTALGDVGRPSFVIEYSEVKTKDAEDNAYAECAEPSGSNSSRNNQ